MDVVTNSIRFQKDSSCQICVIGARRDSKAHAQAEKHHNGFDQRDQESHGRG